MDRVDTFSPILIAALVVAAVLDVSAEEKTLETVVVTATRRGADLAELPYSVSVLDRETIQSKFVASLPDALAQVPGVLIQKSANGQGAPFLRGFTGYRTLTLIDGVRYNNSVYRDGPNEYFSLIDYNALERIEVFGGPSSVLYGSDAIGGALNLSTRRAAFDDEAIGANFIHGLQRIHYATADTSRTSRTEIEFGGGGRWGVHLGSSVKSFGNVKAADGAKQHHTNYGETAWDARLDARLTSNWNLTAAYQALKQDDVWRTFSTIFAQPINGSAVGNDQRRVKDQSRRFGYLRVRGEALMPLLDEFKLTLSHQSWREDGDRIRGDGRRNLEFFKSTMLGIDAQFETRIKHIDIIYGVDAYRDSVDAGRLDFARAGGLARIRIQGPVGDDSVFVQAGAFIQAIWSPLQRLRLEFGSRYSTVHATVGRFEDPLTNQAAHYSHDWNELTNSVHANFFIDENYHQTLWAGLSESFRAPNIADLSRFGASRSNEFEVAATDLDAEKFITAELGARGRNAVLDWSVSVYRTWIREYITSTPTGRELDGLIEVSKANSARGSVHGLELQAARTWAAGFRVWANLTWLEGELKTFATTDRDRRRSEPLSRIMPLTINFGGSFAPTDSTYKIAFDVTVASRADELSSGDRGDTQRIPPGGTPAYEVLRVSLEKSLGEHFELGLALTNLFDRFYRTHGSGVNERGFGLDARITARF